MKKKNCKCDYTAARNENLKKEFYARLGKSEFPRIDDIFPSIAKVGADRFYINEERAYHLLREFRKRGKWPSEMNVRKRLMMEEIRRRVDCLMAFRPKLSYKDAVYEVVNSAAPSFYLTVRSIRTLIYASLSTPAGA